MSGKKLPHPLREVGEHIDTASPKKDSGRLEMEELREIEQRLGTLLDSIGIPSVRFCNELHNIEKMVASKRYEGISIRAAGKEARLQAQAEEQQELAEAKRHASCT